MIALEYLNFLHKNVWGATSDEKIVSLSTIAVVDHSHWQYTGVQNAWLLQGMNLIGYDWTQVGHTHWQQYPNPGHFHWHLMNIKMFLNFFNMKRLKNKKKLSTDSETKVVWLASDNFLVAVPYMCLFVVFVTFSGKGTLIEAVD